MSVARAIDVRIYLCFRDGLRTYIKSKNFFQNFNKISENIFKVLANGFFFTPKATFKDLGGIIDAAIFTVSLIFLFKLYCPLTNHQTSIRHPSQTLMTLRCIRPLKIFRLVPQIRNVVVEMFRGFKEIVMVTATA